MYSVVVVLRTVFIFGINALLDAAFMFVNSLVRAAPGAVNSTGAACTQGLTDFFLKRRTSI